MLSPEQCRAARGWLSWSQEGLSKRASVGLSTLKDFESGKRSPMRNNLEAIRAALECAGIQFTYFDNGRPLGIAASGWIEPEVAPSRQRPDRKDHNVP